MPDINKLKAAGFYTVVSLQLKHPKALKLIKGFSEAKVDKVLEAARKITQGGSAFTTASEYLTKREEIYTIDTGAKELNEILGGGLESQSLTEVRRARAGEGAVCRGGSRSDARVVYSTADTSTQHALHSGIPLAPNVDPRRVSHGQDAARHDPRKCRRAPSWIEGDCRWA